MSKHRFDHVAAMAWYVSLDPGERSSRAVAEKFGVSEKTIAKWRKRDEWDKAAAEADARAAAALERQAIKTREQRALQDARIRDLAAGRVERRLRDESSEVADDFVARVLADADKRVRLNEGEATDHVAVAQVQAGFRESLSAATQLLTDLLDQGLEGTELLRVFRGDLPARVQERLALIGDDDA